MPRLDGPVIHDHRCRYEHHTAAVRPQAGTQLHHRCVEVIGLGQATSGLVRSAVHEKCGSRAGVNLHDLAVRLGHPTGAQCIGPWDPVAVQAEGDTGCPDQAVVGGGQTDGSPRVHD